MLLFRSEEHVDRWLEQRGLPRGAVLAPQQLWGLATAWHGDKLSREWRRRTPDETRALFDRLGLRGEFWSVG